MIRVRRLSHTPSLAPLASHRPTRSSGCRAAPAALAPLLFADDNPSNININDVLGNYSLTLIDSLDTLAVLGNRSEFGRAVHLVTRDVSFDQDTNVQVFEVAIRVLGSLLSAHLIARDGLLGMQGVVPRDEVDELLSLAHDVGTRLLPAFEQTASKGYCAIGVCVCEREKERQDEA